jgi:carboxymethylenebutenolidase
MKDALSTTQVAFLVNYGANDARITAEAEEVKSRLAASGKPYQIQVYEGANHAFFNDTGASYNAAAAADSWTKALAWFRQYLPA